jgi:N-acetylmuramoyl-L-alanine amidase
VKRLLFIFSVCCILVLTSFNNIPLQKTNITTIVIDAGHGGKDPGCIGSKTKEKDIALSIALMVGSYIEQKFKDVKVIFTRKTDVFVELYKRAEIANENKANLFISIHCNSNPNTNANGTEVYVMGLNKSQANLDVAKKENGAILKEDHYADMYDGYDPGSPESNIIFSLFQNAFLDQSLTLASKIQKQFKEKVGMVDRGVKQAGFLVLYKTTMPSVLVETGFLSNPKDEAFLSTNQGRDYIASAIFRAFRDYKYQMDGNGDNNYINNDNDINRNNVKLEQNDTAHAILIQPKIKQKDTLTKKTINTPDHKKIIASTSDLSKTTEPNIYFSVQFATSKTKKELTSPDFKGLKNVQEYEQNGLFKYIAGNKKTLSDANLLLKEVQKKGFKDAFVVAFQDNNRISPEEAIRILKKNK